MGKPRSWLSYSSMWSQNIEHFIRVCIPGMNWKYILLVHGISCKLCEDQSGFFQICCLCYDRFKSFLNWHFLYNLLLKELKKTINGCICHVIGSAESCSGVASPGTHFLNMDCFWLIIKKERNYFIIIRWRLLLITSFLACSADVLFGRVNGTSSRSFIRPAMFDLE